MSNHAYPHSAVFYRRLDRNFPLAVRAHGCWIDTADGRRLLDGSGGALVASLGHGDREIAEAVADAISELGYINGTQLTHHFVEELASELVASLAPAAAGATATAGDELAFAYFLASGSEAIEAAVKLARQVWVERGLPDKWQVISRVPSYHGNTLTALSLSGREHYRRLYGPLLTNFPRIPAPDPYRNPNGPGSTGGALEDAILAAGPDTVAAFVLEPIGGSSSGAAVPTASYLARVSEICRRHRVLLIADEVLCGSGRTGRFLAGDHFGLEPDVVVLGKGLNGGYAPLSALVVRRSLVDDIARGSGAFNHAQTYSHTPTICAAALATLRKLRRERLIERVDGLSAQFFAALSPVAAHPLVGDVRGKGFLAGVELVADPITKTPFPRAFKLAERLTAAAFDAGLLVWPNVGHVDGTNGDLVMLAPPYIATVEELGEIARRLRQALDRLARELA